jgi:hypothetical protein
VVAFDEVNRPASQALPICRNLLCTTHAEIAQEIEDVVRLDTCVHAVGNCSVHLLRIREGTITVPNDVVVPEVKVGRKPNLAHTFILAG